MKLNPKILFWLLTLMLAGCVSPKANGRKGEGLNQYQQLVEGLRKATAASRHSLETLAASTEKSFPAERTKLLTSIERLEVTSIEARARAEAMEKRGEAYFQEWSEEVSKVQDEEAHHLAMARLDQLRQHYSAILEQSKQVRQEFRNYLDGLRRLRGALGREATLATFAKAEPAPGQVASNGLAAERAMDQLLATLQRAKAALRTIDKPVNTSPDKS